MKMKARAQIQKIANSWFANRETPFADAVFAFKQAGVTRRNATPEVRDKINIAVAGSYLEQWNGQIMVVGEIVKGARELMERCADEIQEIDKNILPVFEEYSKALSTQTIVISREINVMLKDAHDALGDVKELGDGLEKMEKLAAACHEMKELHDQGLFKVISDSVNRHKGKQ